MGWRMLMEKEAWSQDQGHKFLGKETRKIRAPREL